MKTAIKFLLCLSLSIPTYFATSSAIAAGKNRQAKNKPLIVPAPVCKLSAKNNEIYYNTLIDTVFYSFKITCGGGGNNFCQYALVFKLFKDDGTGNYILVNSTCSNRTEGCGSGTYTNSFFKGVYSQYGAGDYVAQVGLYNGTCDQLGGLVAYEILQF